MTKLSLLLPVRIDPSRTVSDLDRFVALGLPSLQKFLAPDLVSELIIIAPPEDLARIRRKVPAAGPFPIRVVDESGLCPEIARERGWYKQQIIKIAAASLIDTDWYLTLDADVVCTRPIDAAFLFPGGRALCHWEQAAQHQTWWDGSRDVLQTHRTLAPGTPVMGVTPALMHTASVRSLSDRIAALYPASHWTLTLCRQQSKDWTEYSLYWTNLREHGGWEKLYVPPPRKIYHAHSIWTPEEAASLSPALLDEIFAPGAGHGFFVFQSRAGQPLPITARLLRPRLGLSAELPSPLRSEVARHATKARLRNFVAKLARPFRRK